MYRATHDEIMEFLTQPESTFVSAARDDVVFIYGFSLELRIQ